MTERTVGHGAKSFSEQRYEELRGAALGVSTAALNRGGLALLNRSGVAEWMKAWAHYMPAVLPEHRPPSPPVATHGEVVTVLAEMTLAATREVRT